MNEHHPSPETSAEAAAHLALIRQVIARSKAERARSGDIYLVWGVIIVLADASAIGGEFAGFHWGWLAYPLSSPIGMIYAAVASRRRQQQWSTFGSRVEGQMWIFVTFSMLVLMVGGFSADLFDVRAIVPLICAIVGIAVGTSGALFESRMMTAAGILFVLVGGVSCFMSLILQHVLFMMAMVAGYIIPSLVMLRSEKGSIAAGPQ